MMICFPNCKINLGLSIIEKREDGFHNLETIMYPINLCDILEIIIAPDKQFEFNSSGLNIDGKKFNNLVVKAYTLLQSEYQLPPVKIHLHKVIPIGAGLGGGSANAAFTIKTLNKLFNLGLSFEDMQGYASVLGADCAFFIENKPVIATKKGDQFSPLDLNLANFYFTIIKPNIRISTSEAYSWIKPRRRKESLQHVIHKPIANWKNHLNNDFENEVFSRFPIIKQIKDNLYKMGASYASMSGSGSAVYGIFKEPVSLKNHFQNYYCWSGKGF
jgi:4-diphosphocytidyl-2-C-methyl-D-erythritol kinase